MGSGAIMNLTFVKLFIETDTDDLLAEEEAKAPPGAPVPAQSICDSHRGRPPVIGFPVAMVTIGHQSVRG